MKNVGSDSDDTARDSLFTVMRDQTWAVTVTIQPDSLFTVMGDKTWAVTVTIQPETVYLR